MGFSEVEQESFDKREKKVLELWEKQKIFEKSLEQRKGKEAFVYYDGPPFATGLPHYGHHLAGTIKDVIPRYKTMKGYYVSRRFGWDCHGLPVEQEIEKEHNLSGAQAIESFGIARFNEECRGIVQRYSTEWRKAVTRMGRWVDMDNAWKTMDITYMESVWWVFKQLYDKGLIYEGYKVMPFSAKLGTPLSNFEAGENYKEVDDPSLTVAFTLEDDPETALLAWTTTPWTLISNLALMVGPDLDYVKIEEEGKRYILAKSRLPIYFPEAKIIDTFKGKTLLGKTYQPLFPYFADQKKEGAFKVIAGEEIATDEGTGIVHSAPAFGEADFYACQKEGIALVCPVDNNGKFTSEVPDYKGLFVKDADKDIIKRLKKEGSVIRSERCHHRYPFCWRSDTPLIYKAVSSWFVAVEKIKEKLLHANHQIHWTPASIKYGRFGKWLEGARDWAISRNRYWGNPIPIWQTEEGETLVVGSIKELEKLSGEKITDLHRHHIDDIKIVHDGKTYRRIPQVFDCWFESGSAPYARNHHPFNVENPLEKKFPADFIAEGLDQTRGWFYTLTVLAAALYDQPAFKNVIVNGIILAEDGSKMSKRLQNYPDPAHLIEETSADAVRLYMLNSPAARADDFRFSKKGVELVLRQVLIPWWNAYTFFITYARLYNWKPTNTPPDTVIDRWMISKLHQLVHAVEEGLDAYDLSLAVQPFVGFIDQLTNWYIRRSRRRFWEDEATPDRDQAFATLYNVLITLSKIAAPFVPFVTETIYQNLRTDDMPTSVHLCNYPTYDPHMRDEALEATMSAIQTAVSLGHSLRKEHKFKVRQPLATAYIASDNNELLSLLESEKHLIAEELNVKQVAFSNEEEQFVALQAKPHFRILGKKVGKHMPTVKKEIESFTQDQLKEILNGGIITLSFDGEAIELSLEEILVERTVLPGVIAANQGQITVALETTLTDELEMEGLAREVVNKLNTMRRDAGLHVSDRIDVTIDSTDRVSQCFETYKKYIQNEVLALSVKFEKCEGVKWDLNGEPATITLKKSRT